jgi:phosphoglycolate phosphatase-like HAD superfamily hydrolase
MKNNISEPKSKDLLTKKVIFWDFDGVILDSMPVRNRGFELVLKDYPDEDVNSLMKFHLENGGLSRYVKFRYFFEKILNKDVNNDDIDKWAQKFSAIMRKELVQPKLLINDSINFIKENNKNFEMHIVSGSDGDELRYLCDELGISQYFISIHGSPVPKKELVHNLLLKHKYIEEDTALIGDSINDFEAANVNNVTFYGYNNKNLKNKTSLYIESFNEIY